ncbi:MAG TPA: RodZ domain-containing protein [Marmoricola sp.]|nr:RodZ domain-containing protein [Marmoricola sp.]
MSIGSTLAAARETAGLTLEDVAAATRIRRTLIMNIENDDYSACGGDFYARGHLRNIAVAVGLDPAPLLAEFDAARPDAAPARATEVFESETTTWKERRGGPNWSAAMAAALVLVIAYGLVQAFSGSGGGGHDVADPGRTTSAPPSTSAPASPTPSGDDSAVAQAPRGKVTVVVRATDRSWVQVTTTSGQELFQGLLQPGQQKTFTDKTRLKLVIGNAGGVELTVNGSAIGAPGRRGQVARVQFTPEDPAAG